MGYIERLAKSAKRDAGEFVASKTTLANWASEQRALIKSEPESAIKNYTMCAALAEFEVDPIDDACAVVYFTDTQQHIFKVNDLAGMLRAKDIAIFKRPESDHADSSSDNRTFESCVTILPFRHGKYMRLELHEGVPANNCSFIDCLHRTALKLGLEPIWTIHESIAEGRFSERIDALVCSIERDPSINVAVNIATPTERTPATAVADGVNRKNRRKQQSKSRKKNRRR